MKNSMRKQKGFSLVELVAAFTAAGVLAAGASSFSDPVDIQKVEAAVADTGHKLNAASVDTAWTLSLGKLKTAPSLSQLADAVKSRETATGAGTVSSDGKGICLGAGFFVATYADEDGRIPTVSGSDVVKSIGNGAKNPQC